MQNCPSSQTGAVLLRLAIVLAARKGVRIIAPVHDAILIEAREEEIDEHVRLAIEAIDEACRAVLGDVIRTEHQIIRADGRFYDEKGKKLWDIICNFHGLGAATVKRTGESRPRRLQLKSKIEPRDICRVRWSDSE